MKHTPGPWISGKREDGSRWLSIGDPAKGPHFQGDIVCSDDDAHLIAAAPDMYAAAKEIADHLYDPQDYARVREMARAAIAKAEGGDQ